jgi:hypothetical protein
MLLTIGMDYAYRGIRTAFCKADQDQLASFLAANPGDLNGNAIYKEFAQTVSGQMEKSRKNTIPVFCVFFFFD